MSKKQKWTDFIPYDGDTCLHCGLERTAEGHDGCLGIMKGGVMNACCGHGDRAEGAYIQYRDGRRLGEDEALEEFKRLGIGPEKTKKGD